VSRDQSANRGGNTLFDGEPEDLSREELIALVRELRDALSTDGSPLAPPAAVRRGGARAVPGVDFTVVFDGGSLGNPGKGYGSYEIVAPEGSVAARTLQFGNDVTNNQAEFRALIGALEDLLSRAGDDARALSIAVRGDSQLVIRGLTGEWRVKHPGLQPLHRQASDLMRQFGNVDLAWHPRQESVRAFGH
jgi:ribonuclease HI